jgi:phosphoserine phosphatase RsbU/P
MPEKSRIQMREEILATTRILIVDDLKASRIQLHEFCKNAGFVHMAQVMDGAQALAHIRAHPTDLVLLDMVMPTLDGLALCEVLAAEKLLQSLMVIMLTASDNAEVKAQAFEVGVTDLITKPLVERETMARVMAHLERRYLQKRNDEHYRRMREEMNEAVMLQNILLPDDAVVEGIARDLQLDMAHYYHPARELAGDYISIRRLADDRVALISVDISGHGLTAALYAFSVHTLIEDALLMADTPAGVLCSLNSKLHGFMRVGKFATAWIAIIDTKLQVIDYAAAASPPPLLVTGGVPRLLATRGQLLGVDEVVHYENHRVAYQRGDMLFVYSDALVESPDARGATMQMEDVVRAMHADTRDAGGHLRAVVADFYHRFTRTPEDDLSMMLCLF